MESVVFVRTDDWIHCYEALKKCGFDHAESLVLLHGDNLILGSLLYGDILLSNSERVLVKDMVDSILEEEERIQSGRDKLDTQIYKVDIDLLFLLLKGLLNKKLSVINGKLKKVSE